MCPFFQWTYLNVRGEVLHDGADQLGLVCGEVGDFIVWGGWGVVVVHGDSDGR